MCVAKCPFGLFADDSDNVCKKNCPVGYFGFE